MHVCVYECITDRQLERQKMRDKEKEDEKQRELGASKRDGQVESIHVGISEWQLY